MDSHQTPAGSSPSDSCRLSRVGARRAARNPALHQKLRQMALPLAPLVQVTSGEVHQAFPRNLLSFWLLTDEQLDSLAVFYHQRDPSNWTLQYPCPIVWRPGMTVEEKRRKLGKFIGLRGCDTPIEEWKRLQAQHGKSSEMLRLRTEEEIVIAARRAREQEELFKRKVNWY
ncbi:hypothetical protein GQ53DRAFT_660264 [Thozetella sp. PMI_491]|nr:hypothetical protein GQ53DRAFT_660264 [Thozetella sp. PMI_491]